MTISKFYEFDASLTIINLSQIEALGPIKFEETSTPENIFTKLWNRLTLKEPKYTYEVHYDIHNKDYPSFTYSSKLTREVPISEEDKIEVKKKVEENRTKLFEAMKAYDISSRTLNSQNNSNNEGV